MVSNRNSSKADVEIDLFPKLFLMLVQVVVSLSGPILADFSTNNKHGSSVYLKLNFCTSAQWESALEVRGQIEHSSNYFTIWKITKSPPNLNGFVFRKKNASVLLHLSSSFNIKKVQIWPRKFPLCSGGPETSPDVTWTCSNNLYLTQQQYCSGLEKLGQNRDFWTKFEKTLQKSNLVQELFTVLEKLQLKTFVLCRKGQLLLSTDKLLQV